MRLLEAGLLIPDPSFPIDDLVLLRESGDIRTSVERISVYLASRGSLRDWGLLEHP